ncbi:MAG: SPOR domain-containing protein [Bacteroidota bacterium]
MVQYNQITILISELLYKLDCVIVPNLGGFVARNYASHFTKGNSLLIPPTKQILFNKNLKHNDGLLISEYSKKFNIAYDLASKQVEDFQDYIASILQAKKRFELLNLGLLYIDLDNEIRFEPKIDVNFLIDSFGFEPIAVHEIERIKETRVLEPVFENRKISLEHAVAKKYSFKQVAIVAIGLPLMMTLVFLAANSKPLEPVMHSSFNPFFKPVKKYTKLKRDNHQLFYLDNIPEPTLVSDKNGNAIFKLSKDSAPLVASDNHKDFCNDELAYSPVNLNVNISAAYQVVVGCFGIEANAKKFIKNLNSKNLKASITGLNDKGLHVVSCGGFNDKEKAYQFVNSLKETFPNAWVMAK